MDGNEHGSRDLRSQELQVIVEEVATVPRLRLEGPIQLHETVKELGKGRAHVV